MENAIFKKIYKYFSICMKYISYAVVPIPLKITIKSM